MSKVLIHTRFNVAESKNKDKVYDRHDNVDRLSYVNSTLMVQRLINEGKNLNAYRAQALRSGSYTGDMKEIVDDNGIPTPVYQMDPVVSMPIIEHAQATLEASINNAAIKHSEDSSSVNTASDKTVASSAKAVDTGVASAD